MFRQKRTKFLRTERQNDLGNQYIAHTVHTPILTGASHPLTHFLEEVGQHRLTLIIIHPRAISTLHPIETYCRVLLHIRFRPLVDVGNNAGAGYYNSHRLISAKNEVIIGIDYI